MDKQESILRLLLAQRETTWDALKQWTDDLNKLIYWLALMSAAATAAASGDMRLALAILAAAVPAWLYMYLRGSYWYGVNITVLAYVERRINSIAIEEGTSEPLPSPALVQARAGCDGNMSVTGPLRAPWLALVGATATLIYILAAGLQTKYTNWQDFRTWLFCASIVFISLATIIEFHLFCKHKMPKLKRLPNELMQGLVVQERNSTHNTAAQADSYAAA